MKEQNMSNAEAIQLSGEFKVVQNNKNVAQFTTDLHNEVLSLIVPDSELFSVDDGIELAGEQFESINDGVTPSYLITFVGQGYHLTAKEDWGV